MRRQTTTLVTWGALIALVLAAIVWLSRDQDVANTSPPSPKTAADGTANRGDSLRSRVQEPASPAARIPSGQPAAPLAIPAVHLRFQAPSTARVGEAFDYVVTVDAQQAVGRMTLEVSYDPVVLKARGTEEIDYTNRPQEDGRVFTKETSDGRIVVAMVRDASRPVLGSVRMAIVQFEALAPGGAQISVSQISVADVTGGALSVDVSNRQSVVDLN